MIDGTDVGIGGVGAVDADDGDDAGRETGRLIRPYAMTGGRTLADTEISLEAQIQATTRASQHLGAYRWEAAKVVELVQSPMALRSEERRVGKEGDTEGGGARVMDTYTV